MAEMMNDLSSKDKHDIESALFRIKHIHTMLSEGRPLTDFSPEILESFEEAIQVMSLLAQKKIES